jgi:hypothetical protein
MAKRLITRQLGKPISPIVSDKAVNRFLLVKSVQMTEQINTNQFLVSKARLEITGSLIFQRALIIVDLTDKQIKLNQLIFHKQENSTNSSCLSVFLLLIHINYFLNAF